MAVDTENDAKTLTAIQEALIEDGYDEEKKLEAVGNLKKIFRPPNKLFQYVKIETLLENAWISLQYKTPEKAFLFKYGISLVGFLGKDEFLNSKVLHHLEFISMELKKLDKDLVKVLASQLWHQFQLVGIFQNEFLKILTPVIEEVVLGWMDDVPLKRGQVKMAASSPELFQVMTSILYQVLIKSQGNQRVLDVTREFVSSVLSVSQEEGTDFLRLYPKDCHQLVSLLMVPPDIYSEGVAKNAVVQLLSELFRENRNGALILLSHYSSWAGVLKLHLDES